VCAIIHVDHTLWQKLIFWITLYVCDTVNACECGSSMTTSVDSELLCSASYTRYEAMQQDDKNYS